MSEDSSRKKQKLVELIKRIAREICYEVLDEHLDEYVHKVKPQGRVDIR